MKRFIGAAFSLAAVAGVVSCTDTTASDPDEIISDEPSGMVVSNPSANRPSSIAGQSSLVAASSITYVSAAPGTFPQALYITIRNETTGGPIITVVPSDGGFDPIGIEAEAGNELSLTAFSAGPAAKPLTIRVPPRRPPVIVRTNPQKGRTDVALNVQIVAVFSEPVDRSSVTSSSVELLRGGTAVNGKVEVTTDGLTAEFIPTDPLLPASTYTLVVHEGIRDQDGDALADTYSTTFTTGSVGALAGSLEITMSTSSEDGVTDADGYTLWVGGKASNVGINQNLTVKGLSAGNYAVSIVGIDAGCHLLSGSFGSAQDFGSGRLLAAVNPGATTRVTFPVACYKVREVQPSAELAAVKGFQIHRYAGGVLAQLTSAGRNAEPAWSPDGKRIAFTSDRDGNFEIYVMNADGSGQVRLTNDAGIDNSPSWSSDGKRIAFSSSRDLGGLRAAIYVMNADGTAQVRITSLGARDVNPAWSPDGSRIAFMSDRDGTLGMWTLAPDGSAAAQVGVGIPLTTKPAWSPDSRRIAFHREENGRGSIFIMNSDGSGSKLINSGFHSAINPAWSPDGQQIALTAIGDPNTSVCGWSDCEPFVEVISEDGKRFKPLLASSAEQAAWRPK